MCDGDGQLGGFSVGNGKWIVFFICVMICITCVSVASYSLLCRFRSNTTYNQRNRIRYPAVYKVVKISSTFTISNIK